MSYIGNSPGVASQRVTTTLTATAGQTQFTTQSGYVLGYVDVYLNGAKLVNGSDFEAITGTYITLFAGASAGDVIELVSYVPRGLSDGYTKAEADAKFLDVGGDTASGAINLGANGLVVGTNQLVASGGKVGVGTASPTETLTVVGNIKAGYEAATGIVVGLTDSVPNNINNAYILWGSEATFGGVNGDLIYIPRSSATASHRFYTGTGGLASEKVRISNDGNFGIGTTSPWAKLSIAASNGQFGIANGNTAGGMKLQAWTAAGNGDGYLAFEGYTKEYARFTSTGNFGVGNTVQPGINYQFGSGLTDGFGAIPGCTIGKRLGVSAFTDSPVLSLGYYSSAYGMDLWAGTTDLSPGYIDIRNNDALIFRKNTFAGSPTETMRIAANGNVGIGNSNPLAKLHIEGNSLTLNTENSAQEKTLYFRYSNGANVQSDSYLVFKTGGSPQERMRIDADGNWKLGTTGFSTRAVIAGTNTNVNTTVNNTPGLLFLYDTIAAANAGPEIVMGCSYDGNNSIAGTSIKSYKVPGAGSNSDQFDHGLIFKTSNYPTGIREVARINHNGRLCIGYSSTWNDSAPYLQVRDGIVIGSTASSALFTTIKSPNGYDLTLTANANPANLGVNANIIFRSGNSGGGGPSELMRITSAGNLLIGTTIESGSTGSVGMRAGSAGQLILLADNGSLFHQAVGNYYLVTTAGGSTSDATLKTNVQQLSGALAKVCAIRGVNFEFVDTQKCTSDNGTQLGVIAQEVEPHYPEIVLTDSSGKKTVRYDRLVAPLIEAIKEQQALIQQLQQDVAQLKGATQ